MIAPSNVQYQIQMSIENTESIGSSFQFMIETASQLMKILQTPSEKFSKDTKVFSTSIIILED
jgi:hypothetical protein